MSVASINQKMKQMRAAGKVMDVKAKGAIGESIVMDVVHDIRTKRGGILKQGFMYPYASNSAGKVYLGNIFYDEASQSFKDMTRQLNDEIDVLYISNYRIYVIEVKSYHAKKILIDSKWFYREGKPVDKSPLTQAEKHARHLYHQLYEYIPGGIPDYIVPIVCLVDEAYVDDQRSPELEYYLPVIKTSEITHTIMKYEKPPGRSTFTLDLSAIEQRLIKIQKERTIE